MNFWENITKQAEIYKKYQTPELLEELILAFKPYAKTCAKNAQQKAQATGAHIPFEDFYSNFLMDTWRAIESFVDDESSTLKNIIHRRIRFSECDVWRKYGKKTNNKEDKNNLSYVATRWSDLSDINEYTLSINHDSDEKMHFFNQLKEFSKFSPCKYNFIFLLLNGYSSSEAAVLSGICKNYDNKARKKVERIKKSFKEFIGLENECGYKKR